MLKDSLSLVVEFFEKLGILKALIHKCTEFCRVYYPEIFRCRISISFQFIDIIEKNISTSRWLGTCNSTIFLSRRFHITIYFYIEFPWNETPVWVPWTETNWRHSVIGPELPFVRKRKGILTIDQSVEGLVWKLHAPTHRLLITRLSQ